MPLLGLAFVDFNNNPQKFEGSPGLEQHVWSTLFENLSIPICYNKLKRMLDKLLNSKDSVRLDQKGN